MDRMYLHQLINIKNIHRDTHNNKIFSILMHQQCIPPALASP